jgi:hypothetical protein
MAPSTLDFLIDEHDLTTPPSRARFVRAGNSTALAPHPVHGQACSYTVSPWSWSLGFSSPDAAAPVHLARTNSAPSTSLPMLQGVATPVHPTQADANTAISTKPINTVGLVVPNAHAQELLLVEQAVPLLLNRSPSPGSLMRTPCTRVARLASHSPWIASTSMLCHVTSAALCL